jgi:8-oxo-dGTP pyrophosphatase MutT (NUDIX family)
MSGGHVEYHQDLSTEECARRELQEEFGIRPENIIKTVPIAIFEDFLRDGRNCYVSTLYAHWINQIPKPSDEHKVVVIVTLDYLSQVLKGNKKIKHGTEELPLLNGHDSMLAAALDLATTKALVGEIASTY